MQYEFAKCNKLGQMVAPNARPLAGPEEGPHTFTA